MNKEIKYSGCSVIPADYEASDGQLSLSVNLIQDRSGSLVPILPPSTVLDDIPYTVLSLHKVAGQTNVICFDKGRRLVLFIPLENPDAGYSSVSSSATPPQIAILGNTIFISDGATSSYALWSPDSSSYIPLGASVPEIDIDFALGHSLLTDETVTDTINIPIPEGTSSEMVSKIIGSLGGGSVTNPPRTNTDALIGNLSDGVIGFVNKTLAKAHADGKFILPFMVRWAIRLFDGSYIHQSAPILMVPNSSMPPISFSPEVKDGMIEMDVKLPVRKCTLMYRCASLSAFSQWKDIVRSVDIFVSAPVYTYDQSGSVSVYHRSTLSSFSHSGVKSVIGSESSLPAPDEDGHRRPVSPSAEDNAFYEFQEGNAEGWLKITVNSSGESIPGRVVIGRPEGVDTVPSVPMLSAAAVEQKDIEDRITSVSAFYLIASVPVSGLDAAPSEMPGFLPVDILDAALSNITVRPVLPDDWRSHEGILFTHQSPYNSRLVLSGISSILFKGFSVPAMSQFRLAPGGGDTVPCVVWIKTVRNFKTAWTRISSEVPVEYLPRFLYYPDPNATEMRIVLSDGSGGWQLPLRAHDFLNGAYWFDGIGTERTPKSDSVRAPEDPGPDTPVIPEPQKIFVSEVGSPFYFPLEGRITVGSGSVMATSAAVQALSQGQFGQFPLYAFTSEGVWALSVSSTGTITAVQPVSRDVCVSPESITQIDAGVLFATSRGIMHISGASVQCISSPVDTPFPFSVSALPSASEALASVGKSFGDVALQPFDWFLQGCRLAYDYAGQRIHLFNPSLTLAYVYSLESRQWGMEWADLVSPLNSYPDALAVSPSTSGNNRIVNLSRTSEDTVVAILLTRPMSFGAPDILKTVSTMIQRGNFAPGEISTVLYGSRDLSRWHLVASSVDHAIRNISGTPYKAFRILLICRLSPSRSISSLSIEYLPRLNNRLR